ncbi:UTP--glucose-1-phosphate uridylyltransferase, partial [Bienertia sinuspersici]
GMGLGAIVHDYVGDVLMVVCDRWVGEGSVLMGEAMAVRSGLKIAIEAGFRQLIVEVDNLGLFYALSKKKMDLTAYCLLLKDIFNFCSQCLWVSFALILLGEVGI